MARRHTSIPTILLASLTFTHTTSAQQGTYYFTGAVTVQGGDSGYSPAQQKVCPANYPQGCDDIGASDYCCPSGNTCTWSNSQVACCATGQTCSGWSSGDDTYQPTSYYAPPPATTVYAGGGAGYVQPAGDDGQYEASTPVAGYAGYCSTYYAQGPDLPTTIQGDCGTVLVVEPSEAVHRAVSYMKVLGLVGVLQLMGGLLLFRR